MGADIDEVMKTYPKFPSPKEALMAISTDMIFTCSVERAASPFSASGAPVYRYLLTRPPAPFKVMSCLGAPHVSDVLLIFSGAFPKQGTPYVVGDTVEQAIAKSMIESWGNFVRTGFPGPNWPQWTDDASTVQLGNATSADFFPVQKYRREVCSMIDRLIDPLTRDEFKDIVV